jgi:hypothetical protein
MIPFVKNKRCIIRSLISVFIVIITLFLSCCSGDSEKASVPDVTPDPKSSPADEENEIISYEIPFQSEIIRTDAGGLYIDHPAVYVFRDRADLEMYYNNNKEKFYFGRALYEYDGQKEKSFIEIIKKYDDDYFDENQIICIMMSDGTSCVRHTVENIMKEGNTVHIMSTSHFPGKDKMILADSSEWHILLEVSKADTGNINRSNIKIHNSVELDL